MADPNLNVSCGTWEADPVACASPERATEADCSGLVPADAVIAEDGSYVITEALEYVTHL